MPEDDLVSTPAPDDVDPTYADHLREAIERAYTAFDKAIITLAGSAMVASFGIHGIFKYEAMPWLALSWAGWGLSLASVMTSLWLSPIHLQKAHDEFLEGDSSEQKVPGRSTRCLMQWLNAFSLVAFLAGIVFLSLYVLNG